MFIYALKFREKGEKTYKSILIHAKDVAEMRTKFDKFIKDDMGYDVDKRTISWAGNSIPFMALNYNDPTVIYGDLDELT